jgi:hypothetical protein
MKKLIYFVLLSAVAISCCIQKRKFQKGFYISWHKPAALHEKSATTPAHTPVAAARTATAWHVAAKAKPAESALTAAAGNNQGSILKKQKSFLRADPDSCDEITFRKGDVIRARIFEITPNEIKYKRCDIPNGPLYIVRKSDIFMVNYANGTKEVFPAETPASYNNNNFQNQTDTRIMHPRADMVLILGITGILLYYGSLQAIILGRRVLRQIRAQPYRYKGQERVKTGIILGIVKLSLIALVLIILGLSLLL